MLNVRRFWLLIITMSLVVLAAACSGIEDVIPTALPATPTPTTEPTPTTSISTIDGLPVFSVATIDGTTVRLEDLLGTAPVYVLFVPSIDSELDRNQITVLQSRYSRFEELGANIVVVVSELPTAVIRLRDELKLEFPLIADPLNVVSSDWQVSDLFGEGGGGPASFVFNAYGTLVARLIAAEPDDRPSVDEVLQVIEESLEAGAA
jgi:peroxiredoxin